MNDKNSPFLSRLDAVAADIEVLLDKLLAATPEHGELSRPPRLIDHRHILHLQRHRLPIGTNIQTSHLYGDDPVKSRNSNWRMQIVNLVCRDRRSLE